ncbi:hypothetical protein P8452_08387 [Trifolium repens]|nr:Bifunctional inhibitor/lipid-transfer protein/seed storage 2S albumin superfamily protein [Trifolium repens]WJX18605.1 hypothetical protein P8452_08387 [Trifolium repens]
MGSSSNPSSSCCSQLSTVVQSSPQCLCSLLNGGGSSFGITINQTLALSLPSACKVQTPPVSQCKGGNGPVSPSSSSSPVGSPVESPTDSSTESPEGSITPSASNFPSAGGGSKSVPSTNGGSSDGSTIKYHSTLFFLLLPLCFVLSPSFDFVS